MLGTTFRGHRLSDLNGLKPLFGAGVASRIFDAQVNKVHARIAAMKQMTDLGMSVRVGIAVS